MNTLDSRQTQQQRLAPFGQAQPSAPGQLRHPTAADRLQPQLLPRGMEPYPWPATTQAAGRLQQAQQPHPFTQRHLLPQQPLPTQLPESMPPQERLRKPGPQTLPSRRGGQPQVRPTGAVSLQQQLQDLLPRQEAPEPFGLGSYIPASSGPFSHSLSQHAAMPMPSTLPQEPAAPWQAPAAPLTYRPDLQRNSAGSSSGQNALASQFDNAAGSQSMTQALLEPHAFDHLPLDPAAAPFDLPFQQHGSASQSAPQQAPPPPSAAASLPGAPPAPRSTEVSHLMQAGNLSVAGTQLPPVLDPRLSHAAAYQRAPPPPENRAAGLRQIRPAPAPIDAAAAARAGIHSSPQVASDMSSGASCGRAASAAQAFQFPSVASQVQSHTRKDTKAYSRSTT
ncbi:hypothetical protein ABBQ38_003407 [Trebouxia sp. C0009 RCD-2024]